MLIRPARSADDGRAAAIYAPHVVDSHVSFEEEAPDAAEMARRMAAADAGGYPWLVAEADGAVLGYAYAGPFRPRAAYRWTVETGIYLHGDACGRGVGRRLYGALLDELAARGFTQAVGSIALPNPASVALHEALGFQHRGTVTGVGYKAGRWVDVGYWQRALTA